LPLEKEGKESEPLSRRKKRKKKKEICESFTTRGRGKKRRKTGVLFHQPEEGKKKGVFAAN